MAKNKQGLFGKLQSWFSSSAEAEEERVESADPPAASRRRRAPAARAEPDDPNASPEERLLRGTGLFSTFDSAELPEITLPDRNGKPFSFSSLRGTKILLVAWASW